MTELSIEELFSVAGRTVLVTGGSRGIGEMIAAGFLANGAKVYISSRKAEVCDATAERLAATHGGTCVSIPADLAGADRAARLAQELAGREERLDVLVNNAGASWGAPMGEFPESGWDKVMDTNVKGVFFLTQALLPLLRPPPRRVARPRHQHRLDRRDPQLALRQLVLRRLEGRRPHAHPPARRPLVARDILVNAIAPGPFPTWMLSTGVGGGGDVDGTDWDASGRPTPADGWAGRVTSPARAVPRLAGGAFVVGQTIVCDGGVVAR